MGAARLFMALALLMPGAAISFAKAQEAPSASPACRMTAQDAGAARRYGACLECHDPASAPVHSYMTSKHGVIAKLEEAEWDFTLPLADGAYRAPTCAYCHNHDGDHDVTSILVRNGQKALERLEEICLDCHSPRFASTHLEAGKRMYEIGLMKVREARRVVEEFRKSGPEAGRLETVEKMLDEMERVHLKNLSLGIYHQSPDYQWWHGHPALDGDLIRIKSAVAGLGGER